MDNVMYNDDGSVIIRISPDGLPSGEGTVPAPFASASKRAEMVQKAIDNLYLKGCFFTSQSLIRNTVFDKKSDKTTTKICFRTCKTENEARLVGEKIKAIVEKRTGEMSDPTPLSKVMGKWPGDEPIEEILATLKEMDGRKSRE